MRSGVIWCSCKEPFRSLSCPWHVCRLLAWSITRSVLRFVSLAGLLAGQGVLWLGTLGLLGWDVALNPVLLRRQGLHRTFMGNASFTFCTRCLERGSRSFDPGSLCLWWNLKWREGLRGMDVSLWMSLPLPRILLLYQFCSEGMRKIWKCSISSVSGQEALRRWCAGRVLRRERSPGGRRKRISGEETPAGAAAHCVTLSVWRQCDVSALCEGAGKLTGGSASGSGCFPAGPHSVFLGKLDDVTH